MGRSYLGTEFLASSHAAAIQRLAGDPAIAATTRIPHPYPEGAAEAFIAQQLRERSEGTSYVFAITEKRELVGLCGLHGIESNQARELGFWVGRPFWGRGYATFGVKMVLEFAFRNLRLDRVNSAALESNAASRRVLEKNGFQLLGVEPHQDLSLKRPEEKIAVYELTPQHWREFRDAPALAALHPDLKAILRAELAAGNEIAETGGGWPDADSVFVRLRDPFRTKPSPLPEGITYTEPNDPHWWKADFCTRAPRHLLAC